MSKGLIREYFELCPNGVCEDILTESDKRFIKNGGMILSGVIQRSDARNGNGRIYPHTILEREMKRYKSLVEQRMALGELDHPEHSMKLKLILYSSDPHNKRETIYPT